jgi:23S rRNA (uracil1939-C5)-methyltransferase
VNICTNLLWFDLAPEIQGESNFSACLLPTAYSKMSSRTCTVTIDRLAYGPAGVGRAGGHVVFVPGTVPGDEVEVRIEEEKKHYATGRLVTLRRPSPHRQVPPCPYVPRCGGCPWQQVAYREQLAAKEALVYEQMRRIGKIPQPPLQPIIPSPQQWHYRHRIRLRAEDNTRLGFSPARSHELVEVASCLIAGEAVADHLHLARIWLVSLRTRVRWVEVVIDEPTGELRTKQVVLVGNAEGAFDDDDEAGCARFLAVQTDVAGLVLFGRDWRRSWGETVISFSLGCDDLTLTVSPETFTQVNLAGNRMLIASLLRLSHFQPEQRVIELFCGAGNLSLPIARHVRELIGVEHNQTAVSNARENARRVGLSNVQFLCADAHSGIRALCRTGVRANVIVLDPPRVGAAAIIEDLPRLGASMIVYVSCDPATLARDVSRLREHGYQLRTLQPLDLFPHTYHVETIAVLVLTC